MAEKVNARLHEHKHSRPFVHLSYDSAGHGIAIAYIPMRDSASGGRFALGGTMEANARATADSRPKVLQFLKDNLEK
jgi:hypothetical protein